MGFKYTRNELAQMTGLSIETIKKRALKMGLKESFKTINNREVIAYELSDKDLTELKQVLNIELPFETNQTSIQTPSKSANNIDMIDKFADRLLEMSKQSDKRLETYIERALNAENSMKLLTVTESNKDNEIYELRTKVKELELKSPNKVIIIILSLLITILVLFSSYLLYRNKAYKDYQIKQTNEIKRLTGS